MALIHCLINRRPRLDVWVFMEFLARLWWGDGLLEGLRRGGRKGVVSGGDGGLVGKVEGWRWVGNRSRQGGDGEHSKGQQIHFLNAVGFFLSTRDFSLLFLRFYVFGSLLIFS